MNATVFYRDDTGWRKKPIKNGLVYALRKNRYWRVYCTGILIEKQAEGKARVVIRFSDNTVIQDYWESYSVAVDYFTRRTRAFRGVDLTLGV